MAVTALAAGNSAYVLGIFAFVVFYYGPVLLKWIKKKHWKLIFVIPISIVMVTVFGFYSLRSMKVKAEFSNAVRVEQIQVLTETNPIIGSGLGHNVRITNAIYLQSNWNNWTRNFLFTDTYSIC